MAILSPKTKTNGITDPRILTIERVEGMCTDSGRGWEIVLQRGYCHAPGEYVISEETKREALAALRTVTVCRCAQCVAA